MSRIQVTIFAIGAVALLGNCASLHRGRIDCNEANRPDSSFLELIKEAEDTAAYQDYAEHTYLYTQMADNAYIRSHPWVLPDSIRPVQLVDDSTGTGFAVTVFELGPVGRPSRVVLAFRGTEGGVKDKDWVNGNFKTLQQEQALAFYDEVRQRYPNTVPIAATGHSLGGALAIQVSIAHSNILTYTFNTSYRLILANMNGVSPRVALAETGDILKPVRIALRNVPMLYLGGYDCTYGGPIANHSMTAFARCLTQIAAARKEGARESLSRNLVACPVAITNSPVGNALQGQSRQLTQRTKQNARL